MFDPTKPADHSPNSAAEMRGQLTGLKDLIDALSGGISGAAVDNVITANPGDAAQVTVSLVGTELHFSLTIPRGVQGDQGIAGPPFANAVIDAVNTLPAGSAATAGVTFDGTDLRFTFGIPSGDQGNDGGPGPPGPPFAQAVIDGVSTLPAGSAATVNVTFDGTNVRFTFGIPAGFDGAPGINGTDGEVTNAAMAAAIDNAVSGTSNNTNSVATLDTPFVNDPPTLADVEVLRLKFNELILAARR